MEDGGGDLVWVIDTSAILQIRRMYDPTVPNSHHRRVADADYTHRLFKYLGSLVERGLVTFASHVDEELNKSSSPDASGIWSHSHVRLRQHGDPGYDTLLFIQRAIVQRFGSDKPLADPLKQTEDADPWIVAQAYELHQRGLLAGVVTEDFRDRHTTSITTACEHFNLPCLKTLEFLNHCGAPQEPAQNE